MVSVVDENKEDDLLGASHACRGRGRSLDGLASKMSCISGTRPFGKRVSDQTKLAFQPPSSQTLSTDFCSNLCIAGLSN